MRGRSVAVLRLFAVWITSLTCVLTLSAARAAPKEARMPAKKTVQITVEGQTRTMAYVERGQGRPIVFLHGNPTSSFLWRHVMPHVDGLGRAIAPDLIGMGDSEKIPGTGDDRYRFKVHQGHLEAFLKTVGATEEVIFVAHDWGTALAFDWIRRHPESTAGVAYMEGIVQPFSWATFGEASEIFRAWRSPAGEPMILQENTFLEGMLPQGVLTPLSPETMAEYRRPFLNAGEERRPMLTWPREVPIDGEPAEVHQVVADYAAFMQKSPIPKLFINAEPGLALVGADRAFARTWAHQTEVTVPGRHFVQEDSPEAVGQALAAWIKALPSP